MAVASALARGAASRDGLEQTLRRLDRFAHLSDNAYRIPFIGRRIGLDGIVGFVPGIGDAVTALAALYPLVEAWRLGVPATLLLRMLGNIGAIPSWVPCRSRAICSTSPSRPTAATWPCSGAISVGSEWRHCLK